MAVLESVGRHRRREANVNGDERHIKCFGLLCHGHVNQCSKDDEEDVRRTAEQRE